MKSIPSKKALTFGQFIAHIYSTCGKQEARGKVQLAVNAHLVRFLGRRRFLID